MSTYRIGTLAWLQFSKNISFTGNFDAFSNEGMLSQQKLGPFLQNKVALKIEIIKNCQQ